MRGEGLSDWPDKQPNARRRPPAPRAHNATPACRRGPQLAPASSSPRRSAARRAGPRARGGTPCSGRRPRGIRSAAAQLVGVPARQLREAAALHVQERVSDDEELGHGQRDGCLGGHSPGRGRARPVELLSEDAAVSAVRDSKGEVVNTSSAVHSGSTAVSLACDGFLPWSARSVYVARGAARRPIRKVVFPGPLSALNAAEELLRKQPSRRDRQPATRAASTPPRDRR